MKKKLLILGAVFIIGAVSIGLMQYYKPHPDILKAKADYQLSAKALYDAFDLDEETANSRYLDKIIEVSGTVKSSSTDENGILSFTLNSGNELSGVICQMDHLTQHENLEFMPGSKVSLKGICTGMLMDVVLVRCVTAS